MARLPSILVLALGLGLLPCLAAQAHPPSMPAACLDPKAHPKLISTFDLTAEQLDLLRKQYGVHQHAGPANDFDKCGIVDRWLMVDKVTRTYCLAQSPKGMVAVAEVTGPKGFVSETHHDDYDETEGVEGVCYVCAPE
jgi:hypothetical protein